MAIQKIFAKIGFKYSRIFILILVIFAKGNVAQDDVIRVDTNLVSIPVTVLDRDGRYITNLKKEDFRIFEDGVEQEIALFEPTEQPFSIHFLIDESSSMLSHKENLSVILRSIYKKLRPLDRMSVSAFFLDTRTMLKQTEVGAINMPVEVKVRTDADCPDTYLYNAVHNSLKQMKKIPGRKVIVLLTDGNGGGFGISAEDTLREAEEQEAMIYTFKFGVYPALAPSYVSQKQYTKTIEERLAYLRDLAAKTGGRNYQVENISDLEKTMTNIIEELGQQYTVGYYIKKSEGTKNKQTLQIKVKINQPNLAVRSRSSYTIQPSK